MFRRLTELFFMPWMITLGLFMTFCAFSGFRFSANLDGVTRFFALHPFSLYIFWIILLAVGLFFVVGYLVLFMVENVMRPHWERYSDKKKGFILLLAVIIVVSVLEFMSTLMPSMPVSVNASKPIVKNIQFVRGTPVLFEMPIPLTATQIAKEKRQDAAFAKMVQTKNLPKPYIRVRNKIIHGRAQITQIGPDTYQIKMLHRAKP
ncbi:DUF3810 domain-containing protein [Acidithiobacillus thiooxidans]|uniref:Uncharacterized protein n=1 Tax=Acidithiobacillus thiooxidans ATCC 19377 TaxID=637390 RepID=A0A5P9XT04_ACITH|nr:hypothetical protein [Acidithiobacillus thiooxidans]MBU2834446.1 DUF3810 domain-containing protein [Acidithiobacillus thiooxidans]QFX96704.1 hypothetical protein GCD22_02517 [Acidithiobacillus thiooxidans ATCC 19377]